jgi:hypothetical protein
MKRKLRSPFLIVIIILVFISCKKQNTAEALSIQKPFVKTPEYYANLRAYKKTKHQIFYGWYAAYANKEGVVAEYKKSPSYGEHIAGLPDSLDFCSLWPGVPNLDTASNNYNPIAYEEMRKAMSERGIKMVIPTIVDIVKHGFAESDQGLKDYAKWLTDAAYDNNLDGIDLDWEPTASAYLASQANFAKLVEYCSARVGPMSGSGKYLIVDYYQHTLPTTIAPFIDYLVNQAYTQGTTSSSATFLQGRYNLVTWCPVSKFIVTENMGEWWQNGGSPFTEANGNTLTKEGRQMYSVEGMARWNPTQGKKAGWGGFYFDRDYNNLPPYYYVRRSIQIVNPAVK